MTLAQALFRRPGRAAFIPFIMAGDPSLAATKRCVRALAAEGADIIELGVPFSDPVADGPTIQAAAQRALRSGTSLAKVLELVASLRAGGLRTPIVLFTYLNPVLAFGSARFAKTCAASGVEGALVVDLPAEEAGALFAVLRRAGVEPVLLASPTTSGARVKAIGRASGSIVYYVSREGVTGARSDIASGIARRLKRVSMLTGKPLIVGFGVSTPRQARALARVADGIVVGSALVAARHAGGERALTRLARRLVGALRKEK